MADPQYDQPLPARFPQETYRRFFPSSGLVRVREGTPP